MSLYKVLNPIGYSGRVERGEVIEMADDVAANYGPEYVELFSTVEEKAIEDDTETDVTKLTVAQLRIKAEEMGLATTGTKADLIERITLSIEKVEDESDTTGDADKDADSTGTE